MSEYRVRSSGEVHSQGEIRKLNPNTSLPRVWDANVCEAVGIDPVFETPKPEVTGYTQAVREGVTQDANGNWVQAWAVVSMFSEYTDDEGVTHTKAEQEAEYQARLDAEAATAVRSQRDALLKETDWYGLTYVTMPTEIAVYRQTLRDITDQDGFPHTITWPTKP
jgi:hypothetical protein